MLVRDKFKLSWLTYNGYNWKKVEQMEDGKFQYIFEGTEEEKKCLRQYVNATMPVKTLKEELQQNLFKSQESYTNNERNNIIS
jgi:hypothetical protein